MAITDFNRASLPFGRDCARENDRSINGLSNDDILRLLASSYFVILKSRIFHCAAFGPLPASYSLLFLICIPRRPKHGICTVYQSQYGHHRRKWIP
jgi:hypothetical protein